MVRKESWISPAAALAGAVLLLLAGPLPATGQEPVSLSADSLVQYERVRVHLYSPRTLQLAGRVVGSESDSLRLESDAGRMNVAHDQIHRLQIMTDEGNPGGGFLLGALIGGTVVGLGTWYAAESTNDATLGAMGLYYGVPAGALIGGMIGLASSGPTWRDVELRP